jgi:hypothetical protein
LRFVFYLRRHDHLRESIYAESVKSYLTGDINKTEFQFDYFEMLRPFIEAVGLQNVIVRPYNPRLWVNGRLEADFCHAIGFPEMDGELIVPGGRVNESLSREHTFLLSRQIGFPAKERLRDFFAVKPFPQQQGKSKFFMSPEERRQFRLKHAASAQRLGDLFGISDMADFLGVDDTEFDSNWMPFKPKRKHLKAYMADFYDWEKVTLTGNTRAPVDPPPLRHDQPTTSNPPRRRKDTSISAPSSDWIAVVSKWISALCGTS